MADGEGASELSTQRQGAVDVKAAPETMTMETFDYVIIGAGSAGSVLANRLSEDAGTSVCVLEAGPRDWHPYIHLPAGFIKTFHMKSINWAYQQEPGPGPAAAASTRRAARRSAARPRSTATSTIAASARISTPGRSSAIAAGAIRTCCPISSGWSGGSARATIPIAGATAISPSPPWTGAIRCARPSWQARSASAFPRNPDYNGAIQEGVSYAQRTIQNGLRVSAATAFLHPAMKRPNVACAHPCACHRDHLRRQARGRRALPQGRQGRRAGRGARQQGSDPVRRHLQFAAAAAIVRRRLAGAVAIARHRGASRAARRRRGLAGPLRAALGRARQEHQDHQRTPARLQPLRSRR